MNNKSSDTVWHHATVTRARREQLNSHKSVIVWFTGLSGSGKSTLAHAVEERLHQLSCRTFVFDGDNVRHGLCGDLSFFEEDRKENIRRIGEMAKLFVEAGVLHLPPSSRHFMRIVLRFAIGLLQASSSRSSAVARLKFVNRGM